MAKEIFGRDVFVGGTVDLIKILWVLLHRWTPTMGDRRPKIRSGALLTRNK